MRYTPEEIAALKSKYRFTNEQIADQLNERAQELDRFAQADFVEMGMLCCYMEDTGCFSNLKDESGHPFPHITAWMESTFPRQRSRAFIAKDVYRRCKDTISFADMCEMSQWNLQALAKSSTAVQADPEVIEIAKKRNSSHELVDKVNTKHSQHLELDYGLSLKPSASQFSSIMEAIGRYRKIMGEKCSREEAIAMACEVYLESSKDELQDTPMDGLRRCVEVMCVARDILSLLDCYPSDCDISVNHLCTLHGMQRMIVNVLKTVGVEDIPIAEEKSVTEAVAQGVGDLMAERTVVQ